MSGPAARAAREAARRKDGKFGRQVRQGPNVQLQEWPEDFYDADFNPDAFLTDAVRADPTGWVESCAEQEEDPIPVLKEALGPHAHTRRGLTILTYARIHHEAKRSPDPAAIYAREGTSESEVKAALGATL